MSDTFIPTGECTCAGPDGPCDTCIANKEAYEEWLAERRALTPAPDSEATRLAKTLTDARTLLAHDAECMKECHTLDNKWGPDDIEAEGQAHDEYLEYMSVIARIDAHLARQPAAQPTLDELIERARAKLAAMSPEELAAYNSERSETFLREIKMKIGQPAPQSEGRIAATVIDEMLDAGKHPTMAAGFYFFKPAEIASWKRELERRIGQPAAREPEGQWVYVPVAIVTQGRVEWMYSISAEMFLEQPLYIRSESVPESRDEDKPALRASEPTEGGA